MIAAQNEGIRSQETLQRPTYNKITTARPHGSVKIYFIIHTHNNNNKNQKSISDGECIIYK